MEVLSLEIISSRHEMWIYKIVPNTGVVVTCEIIQIYLNKIYLYYKMWECCRLKVFQVDLINKSNHRFNFSLCGDVVAYNLSKHTC
jgi:hypothetical protein